MTNSLTLTLSHTYTYKYTCTHTTFIRKSEKLRRGGNGIVTAQGRRGNCAYYLQHSQAHTEKQRDTDAHKKIITI